MRPEQLAGQLEKQLLPVYLVSGEETLLVQECCDLVRARAKEIGTASVPEACGTAHTSGIWPPVRPVSSEEPRPCSPPLTAPTAVEVMLVTGSECVRVNRVCL